MPMPTDDEIRQGVVRWLGEERNRGASSTAMMAALGGFAGSKDYPHDPADLNRCVIAIRYLPGVTSDHLELLQERVAPLCPQWAALIENWIPLYRLLWKEASSMPAWGAAAPETYDFMRRILDPIEGRRRAEA